MDTTRSRLLGGVQIMVRSESRYAAHIEAGLQRDGAPQITVSVANISPSGFMAVAPEPIRTGTPVRLVLPVGDPIDAEVVWSLNDQFGCRLDGRFSRLQMAYLFFLGAVRALPTAAGARAAIVIFLLAFLIFNK